MNFSRLLHLMLSLILFVTYVGGTFIVCSPHHTVAWDVTITTNREEGHTHLRTDTTSTHHDTDNQQDNHCKVGNIAWMDIYIHKDTFHDVAQVNIFSVNFIPFFMVQGINDSYFYQKWVWIYKQQLYESEVSYANERKNTIEILI